MMVRSTTETLKDSVEAQSTHSQGAACCSDDAPVILAITTSQCHLQTSPIPTRDEDNTTPVVLKDRVDPESDDNSAGVTRCTPERRLDGGWAWVIMAASFVSIAIVDGVTFSFGVLYPELVDHFDGDKTSTALVGSILNGMYMCAGPVASALCGRIGYRAVAVSGSLLSAAAFLASSFSPNVGVMIVTYGFLGGTGFSFQFLTSMVCTTLYFDRWQALAIGVASCGSGVGIFLFPFLIRSLLRVISWQACVRIQAGIVLIGTLSGLLFRPPPNEDKSEKVTFWTSLKSVLDMSLFRTAIFPMVLGMAVLATTGVLIAFVFLPSLALERGVSTSQAAILVSTMGGTNTAGRFLVGIFLNIWPSVHPLLVLSVGTLVGGALTCVMAAYFTSFPLLVAFATVFGIVYALDAALSTLILSRTLGDDRVRGSFGLVCLIRGLAASAAGPIAGVMVDYTGSYEHAFYLSGGCVIATGLLCLVAWIHVRRKEHSFDIKETICPTKNYLVLCQYNASIVSK